MRLSLVALPLLLALGSVGVDGARILGLFATPAKSHCRVFEALFQGLAAKGHHVTFASPCGLQWPSRAAAGGSIEEVLFSDGGAVGALLSHVVSPERSPFSESILLMKTAPDVCRNELNSPQLQKIVQQGKNKTVTYDLVVVETFFFDCFIPFAKLFDAPLAMFASQWAPKWAQLAMGNSDPWATSPYMFLPYTHKMNFWQRMHNVVISSGAVLARSLFYLHHQDRVVQETFGDEFAPINELEKESSLLLINSHPITNSPHANLPNVVEVGGLHIVPAKPLNKELYDYIEDAAQGVILFSLGSLISKDNMDPERLHTLTRAMAELHEYQILWRWDTEDVPNLPPNVKISPWLPQRDVLAHPKIRLFVTHGGLLSAQEATYEGVPRLVMPFFGDQTMNAQRVLESGVGLTLNYYSASSQQIVDAVKTILSNDRYTIRSKELSAAYRDQLESPLDRAVFWSEYVIKHRNADPLRSASADLAWYKNMCLDVFAFLALSIFLVLFILRKVLARITGLESKKKVD